MRKKVFCAGVLALWFLLFCTFFSLRVEEMMIPRVEATTPTHPQDSMKEALSLGCLSRNEANEVCLYTLYEGVGWEGGWRVGLAPPGQYEIDLERRRVSLQMGGQFISCAAKPPVPGEEVRIVTEAEKADDLWLALRPGGESREREPQEGFSVEAQTEGVLLAAAPESPRPFMESRARLQLFGATALDQDLETVYSLNDLEHFWDQLRLLAGLGALVLFTLALWGYSCFLWKEPRKNRLPLAVNACLFLFSTAALPLLLNAVDLPQSLLPIQVVTDVSHYQAEFSEIFSALRQLAETGSQTAQEVLEQAGASLWASAAILLAGALAACALVLAERAIGSKKRAPRGRHHREA